MATGTILTVLLVADPASAHTGSPAGGVVDGAAHPLLGLDHLLAMVAVGVLAALAGNRRTAWSIPTGFVFGMVAGGLLGLAEVEIPLVELAIAASVVALGALVVSSPRSAEPWLPLVAVAFGSAHGHAHGTEIPADATPALYLTAFVVATAALHVAGTGLGLALRRTPSVRVLSGGAVAAAGLALLAGF